MSSLTIIAAIGKNKELGKDNNLIWRFSEDLINFKKETINKKMIMGYKTFMSLNKGKPLNDRIHIVLTSKNINTNKELDNEQIIVVNNIEELFELLNTLDEEVMVIGGSSIYSQLIDKSNKMILTEIDEEKEADSFFPNINEEEWDKKEIYNSNDTIPKYKRLLYTRK